MLGRFYITGYSARFSNWMCDTIEAKSLEAAKQAFTAKYPNLKKIKAYALRSA